MNRTSLLPQSLVCPPKFFAAYFMSEKSLKGLYCITLETHMFFRSTSNFYMHVLDLWDKKYGKYLVCLFFFRSFDICCLSPVVCRLSFIVCRLLSVVCYLSSVIIRLSSVVCCLVSVVCRRCVICCLSFVVCCLSALKCVSATKLSTDLCQFLHTS